LAIEALLQSICPKKSKYRGDKYDEKTKAWIKRALSNYAASGICGNFDHYVDIRNKLSHANDPKDILLYHDLNPEIVSKAYKSLTIVCRQLFQIYFKINTTGGFVTHEGFKSLMSTLGNNFELYSSEDPTPPSSDDKEVSPLNLSIDKFSNIDYRDDSVLGQVFFLGEMEYNDLININKIFRICSTSKDKLVFVSFINDGLIPTGIDRFKTSINIRLHNKYQPKVSF
jgi:hypothetical protein